jgi:HEAT repeat protein
VRLRAIRLLDECDDVKLVPIFLKILAGDEDVETRAEAASSLGKYIELGELEELPAKTQHQVEDALLEKANSEDPLIVRRNALEALGYSSRPEVITLIESAYRRSNPDWQASALFAMGRSYDERWEEQVLSSLLNENPLVRLAAVEAAGELALTPARTILFRLLEEEEEDEITSAAIWSLSQVGGEDVRVYIENLIDLAEDDEQVEFLEEALDNLVFTEEMSNFDLMSYDPDDEEE